MSDDFKQYNNFEIDDGDELKENEDTKRQKIIFFAFLGFGTLALIMAFFQLRYSLRSPFSEGILTASTGDIGKAKQGQDIFLMQNVDTDGDGLTDYDELYVYSTSPYLEDSDSDGYDDKVEIDTQNNPNCPRGGNCSLFLEEGFIASSTSKISEDMYSDIVAQQNFGNDSALLRSMLVQQGIPVELLNQISDADLLKEYSNIIGNAELLSGDAEVVDKEEFKDLTPAEIRSFLESKGVDKTVLDSIDDETLRKDFMETLGNL